MKPFFLIIGAVVMLCFPGIIFNNMQASGLTPSYSATCPTYDTPSMPICYNGNNAGCQLAANQCSLSPSSVSFGFLSTSSPFTNLLSGDIFGFFGSLTSTSGATQHGPFDPAGGGAYYPVSCQIQWATKSHWAVQNILFHSCTFTNSVGNVNLTSSYPAFTTTLSAPAESALPSGSSFTTSFPTLVSNSTYAASCQPMAYSNYTSYTGTTNGGNTNGFVWAGCQYSHTSSPYQTWSFLISIPNAVLLNGGGGISCAGYCHVSAYLQQEQWYTYGCVSYYETPAVNSAFGSIQCTNFLNSVLNVNGGQAAAPSLNFGLLAPVVGFIIGLILFVAGLSISFTLPVPSTNAGVAVGSQGARLAQIFGMGLLIWTPLYSEFGNGSWLSPIYLPYGLSIVMTVCLTGTFFLGLFWQLFEIN